MKRIIITSVLLGSVSFFSCSTEAQSLKDILNKAKSAAGSSSTTSGSGGSVSNLSSNEIVAGLKEALEVGAKNAGGKLNIADGFFGNAMIKVLMPAEAQKVENTLRQVGMGSIVDKAILSMNRAAEDASGKAAPIFINAITTMSIQDGVKILTDGNGAATNYLKIKTTQSLTDAFRPVITNSLAKVNATAYWAAVFNAYNRLPTTINKINPDLTAYVTERALNGLFVTIAEEENKIRTNPAARVTSILKKVFGAH